MSIPSEELSQPRSSVADPSSAAPPTQSLRRRGAVGALRWIIGSGLFVGMILSYGHWRFGSPHAALGALLGDSLLVDSPSKSFGEISAGEEARTQFQLTNNHHKPVRIIGAETDCGCLLIREGMPFTLAPQERRMFSVSVSPPKVGDYEGRVMLYTSAPNFRTFTVRVFGKVLPSVSRE